MSFFDWLVLKSEISLLSTGYLLKKSMIYVKFFLRKINIELKFVLGAVS